MPEDGTLWEYFSRFWYVDLGEVYTPVVVFDQFEELFTLYQPEQRASFIEQFAAIANRRPPAGLAAEAVAAPQAKFVFSLRSDFLYLLDELSADIPAILRCRFQLRLLDRDRASDAIIRPAAMTGEYASPNFEYSTSALEGILGALGRVSEGTSEAVTSSHRLTTEIAAFQLQLVCRQLEEKIIRQKRPAGFQVSPDFYGGTEGIRQIIEEFYHQVLEKIAPTEREVVEKLLARGLIRSGRRIMMEASAMREEYGLSQVALERLHDERLLKREARKGEMYYEISHDTLMKPVLERFKKIEEAELFAAQKAEADRLRKEAEAREKQLAEETQRAEEAERLKNEAILAQQVAEKEKKNAQKMMFLAIGLAGLASLATLGAGYMYDQADKEKTKAEVDRGRAMVSDSLAQMAVKEAIEKTRLAQISDSLAQIDKETALKALDKARQEQMNKLMADSKSFRQEKRFVDALRAYKSALDLTQTSAEKNNIVQQINLTNKEKNDADFEHNRDIGLALKEANQCMAAIRYLKAALRARPGDLVVKNSLWDCENNNNKK
ncbi:MAG: hypothetical protein H7246_10325 [Phycisphaerae bacterium]|nr:hypothetical protein [Saprospiraceae bacterium]